MSGYVDSAIGEASGTTVTTATLADVPAGALLIGGIVTGGAGNSITSVDGGVGNTFVSRSGRIFLGSAGGLELWSAINQTAGDVALTVQSASSNTLHAILGWYDLYAAFDVQSTGSGNSTAPATGSALTTHDEEVIIALFAGIGATFSAGAGGLTERVATSFAMALMDKTVTSIASYSASCTRAPSGPWTALFASFKAPARVSTSIEAQLAWNVAVASGAAGGAGSLTTINVIDRLTRIT